jgi:HEAT repeat protein
MLMGANIRSVPYALKYSARGNPVDIRQESVRLLGSVADRSPDARRALHLFLADATSAVRRTAVESMAQLRDPEALEALKERLQVEVDPDVLAAIARTLDVGPGEPMRKE